MRILKRLFVSLADLIYLFEVINLYPQLIDVFREDIQDLLGLKGGGPRNPKGEGFIRLLHAILSEGSFEKGTDFNYRRRMVKVMHYLANQKAKFIIATAKEDPSAPAPDIAFRDMIFHDLDRAQVWMNYLDRFTGHETKKPRRVIA